MAPVLSADVSAEEESSIAATPPSIVAMGRDIFGGAIGYAPLASETSNDDESSSGGTRGGGAFDGLGGGGGIDFDIEGPLDAPVGNGGASEGRPGGSDLPLFPVRVLTKLYEPSSMWSALEDSSSEMGGGRTLAATCGGGGVDARFRPAAIIAGAGGADGRDPPMGRGGAFLVAAESAECIPVSSADSNMEDESSSSGTSSVVFFTRSSDPTFATGISTLGRLWGGAGIPRGVAAP
jgi:hypothetical protein